MYISSERSVCDMVSGYVEFHIDDAELIQRIFGDKIAEIRKSDYPTHRIARFENAPDEYWTPFWGQFECLLTNSRRILV